MRALAPSLQKVLGVPVVVLNQEGSGGLRGMEYAAKQPADGYTLFLHTPTHILSEVQNLSSVSLTNNFDPVVCLVQDSVLVVASAKGRFKDWSETAAYANEHPGEVTVAGMSPKGIDAISMRMIVKAAGVDITFVPFGSGAEVNSAILGGHVDLGNQGPAETLEMVKGGEMKAFLVANDKRLPAFPDTPTTYDMGLQVTTGPWRALAAPKGTPPEIIAKLEDAIKKAYESEEFQKWLKDVMLDQRPGWKDSKGLGELWKNDLEFFKNAFKELNL
jgi:tripartite-type tricarboxylate transporter receptor subunit TctC